MGSWKVNVMSYCAKSGIKEGFDMQNYVKETSLYTINLQRESSYAGGEKTFLN